MLSIIFAAALLLPLLVSSQQLIQDPGRAGPALEVVHLYYDEWPTGIAVSSTGRKFSNYPGALDKNNTNNGSNGKYTVAELTSNTTEAAYPNAEWNNPPGGGELSCNEICEALTKFESDQLHHIPSYRSKLSEPLYRRSECRY